MADENMKGMSPVAAGITGLILGIVGTAAIALADKDTRKKAAKKAGEVRGDVEKWSKDTLNQLEERRRAMKTKANRTPDEILDEAEKKRDEAMDEKILHN